VQWRTDIVWSLLRQPAQARLGDRAPSMGAALTYCNLYSVVPLLPIVIAMAGLIFGEDADRDESTVQLRSLMGDAGAGAVQDALDRTWRVPAARVRSNGVMSGPGPCLPPYFSPWASL